MTAERATRVFMISPDSMITPDQLVRTIHATGKEATVKETCYGCLVEGSVDVVGDILAVIRERYPYDIFTKRRAFPAGDPRRCRAEHGTRPGFAQLEAEWAALPKIAHGLRCADDDEKFEVPAVIERVPVERFKKISEEIQ
ncbi:MAG: methanogenesis marker protein 6 [Candidatus Methanoplasma sp.]|jgi:putative methanogenesis marker protein 6|nr:methanogenesis marker protein 6 [Candidatus Methanoplasma sp.]